jgi:hypothetical protein
VVRACVAVYVYMHVYDPATLSPRSTHAIRCSEEFTARAEVGEFGPGCTGVFDVSSMVAHDLSGGTQALVRTQHMAALRSTVWWRATSVRLPATGTW